MTDVEMKSLTNDELEKLENELKENRDSIEQYIHQYHDLCKKINYIASEQYRRFANNSIGKCFKKTYDMYSKVIGVDKHFDFHEDHYEFKVLVITHEDNEYTNVYIEYRDTLFGIGDEITEDEFDDMLNKSFEYFTNLSKTCNQKGDNK